MKTGKKAFFIKGAEKSYCPCCGNDLKVYGSRKRSVIDENGDQQILVIRRLKCQGCGKIHHELPDMLVPFKRYASRWIEAVIMRQQMCCVAVDESTVLRWRCWFSELASYFLDSIIALKRRLDLKTHEHLSRPHGTALEGIMKLLNRKVEWLPALVRMLVNTKMWVQTRSAFLSN
ncbi:DUF6431 domain-containing protein [uncultured Acetobacterium sp.]|uniref:DUF6431 domain-containing protein n=1 Tax=uncultured Acetobacterium sp. TaxID=217139 RepID=UPI0024271B05|nr:DUF6431 domain-containing protein [uncultured Acetobacterium sp.]MBU4542280.1 hypothetical protein [Bacillota bacterium]MDP2842123.1 DUF6431 domain-containing protein [Acetobacterium sp.]